MSRENNSNSDLTTIIPDYDTSVTGMLLLAAFFTSIVISISRLSGWDAEMVKDFLTVLTASSFIALTGAMLLKLFSSYLQKMTVRTSMFTAFLILLAATLAAYFLIYHFTLKQGMLLPEHGWKDTLLIQVLTIATVNYLLVLMIIYHRAKTVAVRKSFHTANLQALQSRIRPHFLFNSMNSIASLIRNNPKLAEHALHDLADLMRVLMADARKLVPLSAEIETSKQYLKIEKLRLGDRLGVQWHINKVPNNCFVPSLVLQPLLENAVYHGIEPNFGGGVIDIDVSASENRVHIHIRNPLPEEGDRNHRKGNKIALDNINARLNKHFGDAASLSSTRRNEMHITKIVFPVVTDR